MKYLVVSDIHGSLFYTKKLVEIIKQEKPNKIILLGDLYYHGPRNGLFSGYDPMEVSKILNSYKDELIVCRGNCDAEVDEMISEFTFSDHHQFEIGNKVFYFTHGHHQNIDNIPEGIDVLVYGHFHTGFIKENKGVICVNSGSISLPKNNTAHSYLVIDEELISLKDIEGNIIEEVKY
ncbi:MAG: phosphodiesterase [Bacilli bacterium]|nr:phosphodiesterase [Bacilli bacterium]